MRSDPGRGPAPPAAGYEAPGSCVLESYGPVPPDTVVSIDGPAGSGKSTTARALAERLGLLYVDSGAMYRALTWAAADAGVDPADEPGLLSLLDAAELTLKSSRGETEVFWGGRDISAAVRTPEVEARVSAVSAHAAVRERMVARQRALGRRQGVVMEGRDIGTVVFPLASAKIYLDATLEARAERRLRQHRRRGLSVDRGEVLREVEARDRRDSERAASPLRIPPDAMVIDNSTLTLDDQLEATEAAVRRLLAYRLPPTGHLEGELSLRYRIAFAVFGSVGRFTGLRVVGREHANLHGCILAPNHVSSWDPLILGAALAGKNHIRSIAKEELFRLPPSALLYRFLYAIPIKRNIYDTAAFDQAAQVLSEGQNLLFFPEGMRRVYGEPGPVRNGLGLIMQRTGAPCVPIYLRGTLSPQPGGGPRAPLEVSFAPAIRLHALPVLGRRLEPRAISREIGRLFEAIYRELQERSADRHPFTDWELEARERVRAGILRKESRTFHNRRPL
ncbi:MAG: (d)CMP kinase [bacterium]|nr:(d)CMP kinase [bacterium]